MRSSSVTLWWSCTMRYDMITDRDQLFSRSMYAVAVTELIFFGIIYRVTYTDLVKRILKLIISCKHSFRHW